MIKYKLIFSSFGEKEIMVCTRVMAFQGRFLLFHYKYHSANTVRCLALFNRVDRQLEICNGSGLK